MSQQIKFFKVGSLPEALVPNAFYYVANGQYAEAYLTTSGFEADGITPTAVLAKKIGNSAMIEEIAGEVVRAANEIRVVADIDARNAIWDGVAEADRRSILVLVVDARDDATVDIGAATYVYNKGNNSWVKIAEYESMDFVIQWADIVGGPDSSPAAIDAAVDRTITNAERIAELQIELNASQTGAGLEADGSFVAPANTNYLSDASSLKDADVRLDTALKAEVDRAIDAEGELQSELDATQAGAGLEPDGSYVAEEEYDSEDAVDGAHYIHTATSLKSADKILDTALKTESDRAKAAEADLDARIDDVEADLADEVAARTDADAALQTELDTTQTGAGLNPDGSYTAPEDTNYLSLATSLKDADVRLDAAIKAVTDSVAALGAAFNYVGVLSGGADEANAFDMSSLLAEGKDAGDYYKVAVAGWFKLGEEGTPFFANVSDGLIFNTAGGVDKIDNTNSEVQGTADYISVTGSSDTGFVVDVAGTFKGRVSTLESEMDAAEGRLDAVKGRLDDAESDIADLRTDLTDAQTAITGLGTRLSGAEEDIEDLQAQDALHTNAIATNTSAIGSLQGLVNDLTAADIAINSRIDDAENRLDDVESDITALQAVSHTHANKAILDDIGADGDNLTYKGVIVSAVWTDAQW